MRMMMVSALVALQIRLLQPLTAHQARAPLQLTFAGEGAGRGTWRAVRRDDVPMPATRGPEDACAAAACVAIIDFRASRE